MGNTATADLEAETAIAPDDAAISVDDMEMPETDAAALPENDAEETPETGDGPDFSQMTPEEIREYIRQETARAARDAEARARESERRKREAELERVREEESRRALEARLSQAEADRRGLLARDIAAGIGAIVEKSLEDGKAYGVNQQWIEAVVQRMAAMTAYDQLEAQAEVERKLIKDSFPGYRPSQEIADLLSAAERSGSPEHIVLARHKMLVEAVRESLRAEVEEEMRAKIKEEQKVAAAQAQARQRTDARQHPSQVAGAASGRLTPEALRKMSVQDIIEFEKRPGGREEINRLLREMSSR